MMRLTHLLNSPCYVTVMYFRGQICASRTCTLVAYAEPKLRKGRDDKFLMIMIFMISELLIHFPP